MAYTKLNIDTESHLFWLWAYLRL